jgi:hypothetical protein
VTGPRLRPEELDRLLREALRDEWAPGEQERLRATLPRAWAEARAAAGPVPAASASRPAFPGAGAALGIAAALVLAFGLAFHLSFPPRLVADSLAVQGTFLLAAAQLHRAVAMDCVLDTTDGAGRPRRYHVEWRAPDEVQLRLEDPDGGTWTRRVPASRARLPAPVPREPMPDDPRLSLVHDFLSPDRIADFLDGRRRVRVTFDRVSGLPVRLEADWIARLDFTLADVAPSPLAGATRRGP